MPFNPVQNINQGLALAGNIQQQQRQNQVNALQQGIAQQAAQGGFNPNESLDVQQLAALDPNNSAQILSTFNSIGDSRKKAMFQDTREARRLLEAGDGNGFLGVVSSRLDNIERLGGDPSQTLNVLQAFNSGDIQGALGMLNRTEQVGIDMGLLSDPLKRQRERTAGQREFESLTEGLTKEQKQEAALIKLGLSPRAVGSAIQTISEQGIEDQIGKSKATIRQREKFGELTASRRSKVIDNGFTKIEKINSAVGNIDRAISVLNSGAGVGAIQKFLPSFKAASVELDNIQKSMALDVIGATTFGALSEGELNLAKEVALPTGLDTPQLIDHLNKRKEAQNKLRDYYSEQIQFLDQGGTVAGFLRSKEREQQTGQPQQEQQTAPGQTFNFDAQGNLIQ